MKQLTRKEIIELRARAICKADVVAYAEKMGLNSQKAIDVSIEMEWQRFIQASKATIEADETNGILCLKDDNCVTTESLIEYIDKETGEIEYCIFDGVYCGKKIGKEIMRSGVLIYNCKPETQGAE